MSPEGGRQKSAVEVQVGVDIGIAKGEPDDVLHGRFTVQDGSSSMDQDLGVKVDASTQSDMIAQGELVDQGMMGHTDHGE